MHKITSGEKIQHYNTNFPVSVAKVEPGHILLEGGHNILCLFELIRWTLGPTDNEASGDAMMNGIRRTV